MVKMTKGLQSELASLAGSYTPIAVYYLDSDCVEYVKHDSLTVYDRIDDYLTLIKDETQLQVIGFKLKGFSCIIRDIMGENATREQFLVLVQVLEKVCSAIGDELFKDAERQQAYAAAKKIARDDQPCLDKAVIPPAYMISAAGHEGFTATR
jgi:hypothetical protein